MSSSSASCSAESYDSINLKSNGSRKPYDPPNIYGGQVHSRSKKLLDKATSPRNTRTNSQYYVGAVDRERLKKNDGAAGEIMSQLQGSVMNLVKKMNTNVAVDEEGQGQGRWKKDLSPTPTKSTTSSPPASIRPKALIHSSSTVNDDARTEKPTMKEIAVVFRQQSRIIERKLSAHLDTQNGITKGAISRKLCGDAGTVDNKPITPSSDSIRKSMLDSTEPLSEVEKSILSGNDEYLIKLLYLQKKELSVKLKGDLEPAERESKSPTKPISRIPSMYLDEQAQEQAKAAMPRTNPRKSAIERIAQVPPPTSLARGVPPPPKAPPSGQPASRTTGAIGATADLGGTQDFDSFENARHCSGRYAFPTKGVLPPPPPGTKPIGVVSALTSSQLQDLLSQSLPPPQSLDTEEGPGEHSVQSRRESPVNIGMKNEKLLAEELSSKYQLRPSSSPVLEEPRDVEERLYVPPIDFCILPARSKFIRASQLFDSTALAPELLSHSSFSVKESFYECNPMVAGGGDRHLLVKSTASSRDDFWLNSNSNSSTGDTGGGGGLNKYQLSDDAPIQKEFWVQSDLPSRRFVGAVAPLLNPLESTSSGKRNIHVASKLASASDVR